jgi:hypothetical protein
MLRSWEPNIDLTVVLNDKDELMSSWEPGIDLTDLLNDEDELKIIEYFECIERKIEYNFGFNTRGSYS